MSIRQRVRKRMEISKRLPRALARLPEKYQWSTHNIVAHPASEILFLAGHEDLGNRVHDATIPVHEPGTGRG